MRVLAVSGSLRADSHNTSLLRAATRPRRRASRSSSSRRRIAELPLYDQDLERERRSRSRSHRLREAWARGRRDPLRDARVQRLGSRRPEERDRLGLAPARARRRSRTRPSRSIGASTGQFGAMWAQADLRKILGIAGARVVGDELPVTRAHEKFDARAVCSTASSSSGCGSSLETLALEAGSASRRRGLTGKRTRAACAALDPVTSCIGRGASCSGSVVGRAARNASSPTLARRFPVGPGDTPLPAGTSTART